MSIGKDPTLLRSKPERAGHAEIRENQNHFRALSVVCPPLDVSAGWRLLGSGNGWFDLPDLLFHKV